MHIQSRHRLMPFSTDKGVEVYLPLSDYSVTVFPDKILFNSFLDKASYGVLSLHIDQYIVEQKTFLNLERGWVIVELYSDKGLYCRYKLTGRSNTSEYSFKLLRSLSSKEIKLSFSSQNLSRDFICVLGETQIIAESALYSDFTDKNFTRYHFGCFKKQECIHIFKRRQLGEILPFVIRACSWLKDVYSSTIDENFYNYLNEKRSSVVSTLDKGYEDYILMLISHYWKGLLVPQKSEANNYIPENMLQLTSIGQLVTFGYWLEKHFIDWDPNTKKLFLFQGLTHSTKSGRVTGYVFPEENPIATIDIQWKSGKPYQVFIKAFEQASFTLVLPKIFKSFRKRKNRRCRSYQVCENPVKIEIEKNDTLLLDCIKK